MRVILLGAGGVSRELLPRLSEMWEATVVDVSADRLEGVESDRPVRRLVGDGSSRVVLERAGLAGADALIAATDDDDVNLEACRLAREQGIQRLAAVIRDGARLEEYQRLGVPTISPAGLAARRVESHLERRRVSSTAFADGRAEAIEFHVAPDSPVCGKSLGELHAQSFVVGAILRGNDLIVPHGDTVLQEDDLVTVVGAGTDFAAIVRTFTAGEARFPRNYGKRVAVVIEDEASRQGAFDEALHVVRNSRASSLLQVHRDPDSLGDPAAAERIREALRRAAADSEGVELVPRPVRDRTATALLRLPREASVGLIVIPAGRARGLRRGAGVRQAFYLARRAGVPVLLSRGTHPYGRILVPARHTPAGRAALRAGIDLARLGDAALRAALVTDPAFLVGVAPVDVAGAGLGWVEEEAAIHGVAVETVVAPGNPVRRLAALGEESDLLVLGVAPAGRAAGLRAGIGPLIARRSSRSVLLVPVPGR